MQTPINAGISVLSAICRAALPRQIRRSTVGRRLTAAAAVLVSALALAPASFAEDGRKEPGASGTGGAAIGYSGPARAEFSLWPVTRAQGQSAPSAAYIEHPPSGPARAEFSLWPVSRARAESKVGATPTIDLAGPHCDAIALR